MHTNILEVLGQATAEQHTTGLDWYREAHDVAAEYGDVRAGAGVLAAVSPMLSWERNVIVARNAFAEGHVTGVLSRNAAKGNAILAGADPLDVLGGDKVRSFYMNILNPEGTDAVTVDRHAYDVATGVRIAENNRPKLSKKHYNAIADEYRRAAAIVGLAPSQVQAITWTVWRDKWGWRKVA